jgi:hypothetical protein
MRVMLMIKGDPAPGAAPSEELVGAMGSHNEELNRGWRAPRPAGVAPKRRGETCEPCRGQPRRHRRAVPRVEAADRGLLDPPGAVDERSRGIGRAVPVRGVVPDLPGREQASLVQGCALAPDDEGMAGSRR